MSNTDITQEIQNSVNAVLNGMQIENGSTLANIVNDYTNSLIDIAARQYAALAKLRDLTGIKLSRINIDDIKSLNPENYDNPSQVAQSMDTIIKIEAEKLVGTADYISSIKRNLNNCAPETRDAFNQKSNDKIGPIKLARTIAGKCIQTAIRISRGHNPDGLDFSISHMPETTLKHVIPPLQERIKPYLQLVS